MLLLNVVKNVCGCKVQEGFSRYYKGEDDDSEIITFPSGPPSPERICGSKISDTLGCGNNFYCNNWAGSQCPGVNEETAVSFWDYYNCDPSITGLEDWKTKLGCPSSSPPPTAVPGCTDETACNYDSTANVDNNSCITRDSCNRCPPGTGTHGENPCLNDGQCTSNEDGFSCECADGFLGENCERHRVTITLSAPRGMNRIVGSAASAASLSGAAGIAVSALSDPAVTTTTIDTRVSGAVQDGGRFMTPCDSWREFLHSNKSCSDIAESDLRPFDEYDPTLTLNNPNPDACAHSDEENPCTFQECCVAPITCAAAGFTTDQACAEAAAAASGDPTLTILNQEPSPGTGRQQDCCMAAPCKGGEYPDTQTGICTPCPAIPGVTSEILLQPPDDPVDISGDNAWKRGYDDRTTQQILDGNIPNKSLYTCVDDLTYGALITRFNPNYIDTYRNNNICTSDLKEALGGETYCTRNNDASSRCDTFCRSLYPNGQTCNYDSVYSVNEGFKISNCTL